MNAPSLNPAADARPRRDFLRQSCSLFTAAVLVANGATLAGCDSVDATDASTDTTGVAFDGATLAIDLTQASALSAVGGALFIRDADVLVIHAAEDDYRAFDSVCPHEQNQIRQVVDAGTSYEIRCPSHGWTFDLNGNPTGSAQRPTTRYALVQDDQILRITVA